MSCDCGKIKENNTKRETVFELARKYQKEHGGIVVFFKCSDYDFTEYENFNENGKTEIQYIL
jgi:hypothetical protein